MAYFLNSYLSLQAHSKGATGSFSFIANHNSPSRPLHTFQNKMTKRQAGFSLLLLNAYKGRSPQCANPLCSKVPNALALHCVLWTNKSTFRVPMSGQRRTPKWGKATVKSITYQGPNMQVGHLLSSSSKWCPQELGALSISEYQTAEKVSLQKDTRRTQLHPPPHSWRETDPWGSN